MALYIFPDGCLRQGIEAYPVAPAVEPYRREFLLPKHGDDPIQRNTARAPDKFGRDLAVQEVSTPELSELAQGRFPEWSNESRRLMVQYLIDNGVAEVARKTPSGTPTWYRFVSLGDRRVGGKRKRLGIPDNELSMLKTEDLEDLVTRVPQGLDAVEASVLSTLVGNVPSAELIRVRLQA